MTPDLQLAMLGVALVLAAIFWPLSAPSPIPEWAKDLEEGPVRLDTHETRRG